MQAQAKGPDERVQVWRSELAKLLDDSKHAKEAVKKIILLEKKFAQQNLKSMQNEHEKMKASLKELKADRDHWKQRYQAAVEEAAKDKEKMLELRCSVQELSNELGQQTDYCSRMGCVCATILWRLSRNDDSVQILLSGSQAEEFLCLVTSTLQSYLVTYVDEVPEENSYETKFIHALAGVTTNVAASAYGREFLAKSPKGCRLVDVYLNALAAPHNKVDKLKSLLLMTLYNLSINAKGMEYISRKPDILNILVWVTKTSSASETRLHAVRLMQSLIYEQANHLIIHQAKQKMDFLQNLLNDPHVDICKAARELLKDLNSLT